MPSVLLQIEHVTFQYSPISLNYYITEDLNLLFEHFGAVESVRFAEDSHGNPFVMNRIYPTRSDLEYCNNNGRFTLIEGSEAGYVGHNFGRAFVSMESGKGARRARSELHGVAIDGSVVRVTMAPVPPAPKHKETKETPIPPETKPRERRLRRWEFY
ncbi:hypothetical protein N7G274_003755 [Stereocaulon virgatum]|uniref:RRM domain-containing protein n=1 Tax=Stereocaulon virgatum TaxID=373712 RepID=A0ABR4AJ45_9LECA